MGIRLTLPPVSNEVVRGQQTKKKEGKKNWATNP